MSRVATNECGIDWRVKRLTWIVVAKLSWLCRYLWPVLIRSSNIKVLKCSSGACEVNIHDRKLYQYTRCICLETQMALWEARAFVCVHARALHMPIEFVNRIKI